MTVNPERMGKNILYYLTIKGLTQVDLAKRLKTSKQVVNKIVKGKRGLSPNEFVDVSEYLGISMEALLTETHDFQLSDIKSVLLCGDKMNVEDANFISALIENLSEMREDAEIYDLKNVKPLKQEIIDEIKADVLVVVDKYNLSPRSRVGEDIFEILKKEGFLIFHPFKDTRVWGVFISKSNEKYFVINSSLKLEEMIFAAAHECAHSRKIAYRETEILTGRQLNEYLNGSEENESTEEIERKASRFAAELLVCEKRLKNYINEEFGGDELTLVHVLKLSEYFLVPYKTIIRRLYEENIISEKCFYDFAKIAKEELKFTMNRYELCVKNNSISKEKRYGEYTNILLELYENNLRTYSELKEMLELLGSVPSDFGIEEETDIFDFMIRSFKDGE